MPVGGIGGYRYASVRIFISHSSTDKWVAQQIANHLVERGLDCFLDEKDIETGDSIDEAIQENLSDCDEVLLLLSPASLKSQWVLIELGGAKVLKKRLVPILLHVGQNELPDVLSDQLARDINEIELYYDEVQQRHKATTGERPPKLPTESQTARRSGRTPRAFAKGDRVRLPREIPSSTYARDGTDVGWNPEMERYLGAETTIEGVFSDVSGIVQVAIDNEAFYWLMDWLDPVLGDE